MNIFSISKDPYKAAFMLHDRHVVKMIVESAQLLSTAQRLYGNDNIMLYKECFINHPCSIWVRQGINNYIWLLKHFNGLLIEYTHRFNKFHKCEILYKYLKDAPYGIPNIPLTDFALAMPDVYKTKDPIQSYRNYYIGEKIKGNYWTNPSIKLDDWLLSNIEPYQIKERKYV